MENILDIISPKRRPKSQEWDALYPYYAGFPTEFARRIIASAKLSSDAVVWDPWNGSGTTTYAAQSLGLRPIGFDLNPVMVLVARARLLSSSETDSVRPLGNEILRNAKARHEQVNHHDPLLNWFTNETVIAIRALEAAIQHVLVGGVSRQGYSVDPAKVSSIAASFFVALFAVARQLARQFRSSNPTWVKLPRQITDRVSVQSDAIWELFQHEIDTLSSTLERGLIGLPSSRINQEIRVADATRDTPNSGKADIVVTSPPYCTRIDYAAKTRIELALITDLISIDPRQLRMALMGTTTVPISDVDPIEAWGSTCNRFLEKIKNHKSKASMGYYFKTHADYFDKLYRSLGNISSSLKRNGIAIIVAQDSFYKEILNDLPTIISDMSMAQGLETRKKVEFESNRLMARINPRARKYRPKPTAKETVIVLRKS